MTNEGIEIQKTNLLKKIADNKAIKDYLMNRICVRQIDYQNEVPYGKYNHEKMKEIELIRDEYLILEKESEKLEKLLSLLNK